MISGQLARILRPLLAPVLLPVLLGISSASSFGQGTVAGDARQFDDLAGNQYVIEIPLTKASLLNILKSSDLFGARYFYINYREIDGGYQALIQLGFYGSEWELSEVLTDSSFTSAEILIARITEVGLDVIRAQIDGDYALSAGNNNYFSPVFEDLFSTLASPPKDILEKARAYYGDGQYPQAAVFYKLLSLVADESTTAWAEELLGMTFERMGNMELALHVYQEVSRNFPNSAGHERVQQRLIGLQSAADRGQQALRKTTYDQNGNRFQTRAMIGQYYRTLSRSINDGDTEEVMSLLSTDFDLRTTAQFSGHRIEARVNGYSIDDRLNSSKSDVRIKRAFIEYEHVASGTSITLGRQKEFDSGLFTPFDGVTISYPLTRRVQVSASGGEPVYFSRFYEQLDYSFYSANVNWRASDNLEFTSYYNSQTVNGVTDRNAVGFSAQYNNLRVSTSLHIDYDTAFTELNNLLWNATFRVTANTSITAVLGKQHSPFLTATNILIGQPDLDLDTYLQIRENKDSLLDDALARTSQNEYYSVALNSKLTDKIQLVANYYESALTDIPSSAFLLGQDTNSKSDEEFTQKSLTSQLIVQGLFHRTESTAFGFRSSKGNNSRLNQLFINERLRFGNSFTIAPKLSYSQIDYLRNSDQQNQLRYSLELSYKPTSKSEIHLEVGSESMTREFRDTSFDSYYIFLGYRLLY